MHHRSILNAHRVALLATLALPIAFTAASAQEATLLDRLRVEAESDDILVQDGYVAKKDRIGTKIDTPLVEIPQAISVVTQDQIEDQKPRTLNEALSYTASANPNSFGFDTRYDAFYLRGFPAFYNGMFRDGLRQYNGPSAWFKTEPYGIEGVTILKGPASSLYGISGPGGIVNIVTKRPKEERFREVEMLVGDDNRYQTAFDLSGPANEEGTILYRLTGLGRLADTDLPGYSDDKFYIAPALTFQPDGDTKLTILGGYSQYVTGATAFFYNPSYGTVSDIYAGDPEWNDFTGEQGRIGYEFEHRVNDVFTLRQNLRYSAVDADLKYSGFCSELDNLFYGCLYPERSWGRYKEQVKSFVVDNMAQFELYTGPIDHTMVAGLDYGWTDYEGQAARSFISADDIANQSLAFSGGQAMHQVGVYLHDQMRWDNLTLFASARHDWAMSRSTDYAFAETDQDDSAFSGRLGLSYRTDWGVVPYVNYSTSFSPNLGFVYDYGTDRRRVARPTKGEQVEVGIKYEIPDYNVILGAAYFNIDQKDGVVYDGTFDAAWNQRQRQLDLNSEGLELEAHASFNNGFDLIASYTYMRMTIEKGALDLDGPLGPLPLQSTAGNELSSTPNHVASLWGNYTFQAGLLEGLGLGAGVRYVGESYGDDANSFKNDDRAFVDAAISYDFGARTPDLDGLHLQVNAKNLFDTQKPICTVGNCYRDEGRSVFGSLRYRF